MIDDLLLDDIEAMAAGDPANMLGAVASSGAQMRERLEDLARLRITVFRDWPYLYEGTMEHEREYLPRYPDAKTGTLIVARDGDTIVGASTAPSTNRRQA